MAELHENARFLFWSGALALVRYISISSCDRLLSKLTPRSQNLLVSSMRCLGEPGCKQYNLSLFSITS